MIKKPMQYRSIERVNLFKRSFLRLIKESNYQAVKIEEICSLSNSAIGSFYQFFSDKNELGKDILREIFEDQNAAYERGDNLVDVLMTGYNSLLILTPLITNLKLKYTCPKIEKINHGKIYINILGYCLMRNLDINIARKLISNSYKVVYKNE